MASEPSDGWVCIGCGCTNERACPGGCCWVGKNKCSCCFDEDGSAFAVGAIEEGLFGAERCPASETPALHAPLFTSAGVGHCARCHMPFFASEAA